MQDARWGQKVAAVVELAPGHEFDGQAFERICRERLSGYKVPKAVFLTESVRRSPAGKADYRWATSYAASQTACEF
jgi:fatty-acyl-CoA synthase